MVEVQTADKVCKLVIIFVVIIKFVTFSYKLNPATGQGMLAFLCSHYNTTRLNAVLLQALPHK